MPSSRRMRGDPPSVLGAWVGSHMTSVFHLADHVGMGIEADVRKQLDLREPEIAPEFQVFSNCMYELPV